jgi:hypothetical protein
VPLDEFARSIDIALTHLPLRRLYLRIAWICAAEDARDHALLVARKAALAFADDPVFAEEYQAMQAQLRSSSG